MTHSPARTVTRFKHIVGGIVLVCIASAVLVMTASPRSALYGLKVGVVEPAIGSFYRTPSAAISYQFALLERRAGEMQQLSERADPSPAAVNRVATESQTAAEEAIARIAMHEDTRITLTQAVLYTVEVDTYLRALERVIRGNDVLNQEARDLRVFRRDVSEVVDVRIEQLITRGTGAGAAIFLSDLVTLLQTEVAARGVSQETREQVSDFITQAESEIAAGDLADAISTLIRAYQQVKTELILSK